MTVTGNKCVPWSAQQIYSADLFPEYSLEAADINCRDPSNSGYLWCYIDLLGTSEICAEDLCGKGTNNLLY